MFAGSGTISCRTKRARHGAHSADALNYSCMLLHHSLSLASLLLRVSVFHSWLAITFLLSPLSLQSLAPFHLSALHSRYFSSSGVGRAWENKILMTAKVFIIINTPESVFHFYKLGRSALKILKCLGGFVRSQRHTFVLF